MHSWVEVHWDNHWVPLEGFILDTPYLESLQRRFPTSHNFYGYGAATSNLQNPAIEWCGRSNLYSARWDRRRFWCLRSPRRALPNPRYKSLGNSSRALRLRFEARHERNGSPVAAQPPKAPSWKTWARNMSHLFRFGERRLRPRLHPRPEHVDERINVLVELPSGGILHRLNH